MASICSVSVRSFKGILSLGVDPRLGCRRKAEAVWGEGRKMPLWALDPQFVSEVLLAGALQEEGMRSEAKRRDKG